MIDIEKLKAEQAEKLREAELSNAFEINTGLKGYFHVGSVYGKEHGTKYSVSYGFGCGGGHYFDNKEYPTIQDCAKLLTLFPPTKDWKDTHVPPNCSEKWSGLCRISTARGYSDNYGTLEIQWVYDDIDISFSLRIEAYEVLKPLFEVVRRKITGSELSTYHPMYRGHLNRNAEVPRYKFKDVHYDKQVNFEGGSVCLYDNDKVKEIVELIKSQL